VFLQSQKEFQIFGKRDEPDEEEPRDIPAGYKCSKCNDTFSSKETLLCPLKEAYLMVVHVNMLEYVPPMTIVKKSREDII
jgi:hypothetical protein